MFVSEDGKLLAVRSCLGGGSFGCCAPRMGGVVRARHPSHTNDNNRGEDQAL
jgi:hypothetical protein